jgi:hypothetical protein
MQSAKPDSKPRSSPKPSLPPDCELADHNADAPIIPPTTSKWKIAGPVFFSAFMLLITVMWLYMSLNLLMWLYHRDWTTGMQWHEWLLVGGVVVILGFLDIVYIRWTIMSVMAWDWALPRGCREYVRVAARHLRITKDELEMSRLGIK